MKIDINTKAPVNAKQKIKIYASATKVWSILTEINNWPNWQSSVKKAHLETPLQEGSGFIWSAGGVTLKSKIHTCEPFHAFGWTGKTIGVSAIHNWLLESEKDGTTVSVEETLEGFFPFILKKKFQNILEHSMSKNLQELKIASEK
jgi:hypothetical protein